ncbi:TolB-like translocation protein [Microbispora bryophytorum]|uniref:Dipeptidylpeptidase IV N-terminal domain-containing protein n=1 Tax=Microbispora bryophytorum TaxID=1460882 RepID=A0A8H9H519_9ACTN|nr:hypothetical protein [Microbispora bryophytorum]MBD3139978.1 hypothetical protein [Microbispora bryophytorum]TQR99238.1 hypothetical protein FLX07_34215 [Microbispora bryophytorum]GGO28545.1 hypothetical protein GCM10011574_63090 [Microbispora bryophytorum]
MECPSLSPDGTRIAFKKRAAGLPEDAPWRLYVLDLRTMRETPVAERRGVDDQAVWLGPHALTPLRPAGRLRRRHLDGAAGDSGAPRRLPSAVLVPVLVQ